MFHNTILAYAPKRLSYRYCTFLFCIICFTDLTIFNSDDGYKVRIMLAIMDHNHHVNRAYREFEGERQLHRVWRRRSKRWDVIPKKVEKEFAYIPELLSSIFQFRAEQDCPIRSIRGKRRVGSAITPEDPPETSDVAKRKRSRFGSSQ